ncbi:unnamed protein product [Rodentolepis nana]|uniref:Large ribosomal subunit protein mL52 n=1 Tax=Rodentolepis nana TaxID=102285 RepID=A0A0R3TXU9_RODNA|nr:unnamed protein product [Rodentolepis nana]
MILKPGVSRALFPKLPLKCIGRFAGGVFRARRGLPPSNEWGPLTDLPDYSFLDGRVPKVTTVGQRMRLIKQYEMTKQIVTLSSELNEANKRLLEKQDEETRRIKALSESPLKKKGSEKLV